jgi:hypothetical protein
MIMLHELNRHSHVRLFDRLVIGNGGELHVQRHLQEAE